MELPKNFNYQMVSNKPQYLDRHHVIKSTRKSMRPGVEFSMSGPCRGALHEVIGLAISLAEEAFSTGNKMLAQNILKRIEAVKVQYEIDRLTRQLEKASG